MLIEKNNIFEADKSGFKIDISIGGKANWEATIWWWNDHQKSDTIIFYSAVDTVFIVGESKWADKIKLLPKCIAIMDGEPARWKATFEFN